MTDKEIEVAFADLYLKVRDPITKKCPQSYIDTLAVSLVSACNHWLWTKGGFNTPLVLARAPDIVQAATFSPTIDMADFVTTMLAAMNRWTDTEDHPDIVCPALIAMLGMVISRWLKLDQEYVSQSVGAAVRQKVEVFKLKKEVDTHGRQYPTKESSN